MIKELLTKHNSVTGKSWLQQQGTKGFIGRGLLMANDVSGVNLEESNPCVALSKNDSYVMSAAGGKVSLFNMMTFKVYMNLKVDHLNHKL